MTVFHELDLSLENTCLACGDELTYLGRLGRWDWFRCRGCGWDQRHGIERQEG